MKQSNNPETSSLPAYLYAMIFEKCLIEVVDKLNREIKDSDSGSDVVIKNQLLLLRENYDSQFATKYNKSYNNKISQDLHQLIELLKQPNNIPNGKEYVNILEWYLCIIRVIGNLKTVENDLQYFYSLKSNKIYGVFYNIQILPSHLYTDFSFKKVGDLGLMNLLKKTKSPSVPYQVLLNLLYRKIDTKIDLLKQRKDYSLECLERLIYSYENQGQHKVNGKDHSKENVSKIISLETLQPSVLEKWWLPLLIASQYLPYKATQIWLNRVKIFNFVQHEIIDFSKGLVINWIVQPGIKIWKTISHSESDSLISSKSTLQHEKESMIRMMQNMSPTSAVAGPVSSLSPADIDLIEQNFLNVYESQIKNPWRHIVDGGLIQSILVLVQRAKVEADFGLNSIDKILQSQQLVFQFVAISPAFLTVWVIYNFVIKPLFYNAPFFAFKKLFSFFYRDSLSDNDQYLVHLNKLLKYINNNECFARGETHHKKSPKGQDSCFIYDLDSFGEFGLKFIPKKRSTEWWNDVYHVFSKRSDLPLVKEEIKRLDRTYNKYFR
ncbi:hypothetical protein ACO0RG_001555 [Hanseniaspora osmophila]